MSPPDDAPLEVLSPAELRALVGALVSEIAGLRAEGAALKAENQALRDEVAETVQALRVWRACEMGGEGASEGG